MPQTNLMEKKLLERKGIPKEKSERVQDRKNIKVIIIREAEKS